MAQGETVQLPNTLSEAVLQTGALVASDRLSVEERALEILKFAPGQAHALMLLVGARRCAGDVAGARDILESLAEKEPNLAAIHYELGLLLADMSETEAAIAALSRVTELEPDHPSAWRVLANQLSRAGSVDAAGHAYARHVETIRDEVRALDPASRSGQERLPEAERDLRAWLRLHPTDVSAMRMLGGVCLRLGRSEEAERHFARALELSPGFSLARWMLARALSARGDWASGLPHVEILLQTDPDDEDYLNYKAEGLLNTGSFDKAIACFQTLLAKHPTAQNWMYYGHALRAVRRLDDCIAAYRTAIALKPEFGEAYWSLANLKTFRFEPSDIDTMLELLEHSTLERSSRAQMHFAVGKALEDNKQYAASFQQYQKGNAAWHRGLQRDSEFVSALVRRSKAVFTREFFNERADLGSPLPDPIFVIGLPRSGTTLIEQILSSHSGVEGLGELTALRAVAERLGNGAQLGDERYPRILRECTAERFRSGGEEYLQRAGLHRKLGRPFFVDKMPSNFHHLGLLLLILPKAKIIDARRHPLASGFANFKQFYPEGQTFTFDLEEIGRYYRAYVEMMAHFDSLFPGRIHRVFYEKMVTDTDQEIRRLLAYCGLPFEDSCLRFHETERGVLTASAAQVRRPIFTESMDQWRNYERWLGPLKTALGDVLSCYPDVPKYECETGSGGGLPVFRTQWSYQGR